MKTKLSRTSISAFAFMFLAGMAYGYYRYLHRPATFPPNDPKNNAILVHLIIAACAIITVAAIQLYRKRKQLPNIWAAPFSQSALQRLKATFAPGRFTLLYIPRVVVSFLMLVVMLFTPFRSGSLITAGLDPSEPANAWGGPSYLGAAAAHWMDLVIFLYIGGLILNWIMVKRASANKK